MKSVNAVNGVNVSAHLSSDQQYTMAHARQSEFEYQYRTAYPPDKLGKQFAKECTPYLGGCKQFQMTASVVDDYEKVIPGAKGWGRIGDRTNTELFGGPFKARGEGILTNPDALSNAWTPVGGSRHHCNKPLSEVTYDTWSCLGAPLAYETKEHIPKDTRQGLQYITKC